MVFHHLFNKYILCLSHILSSIKHDKIDSTWSLDGDADRQSLASEVQSAANTRDLYQEGFYWER